MTTEERITKLDDEILSLAYMEDKLRRAMEREVAGSETWLTARRQLRSVSDRLDEVQHFADELRDMDVSEARAIARRSIWPPAGTPKLVTFFGIEAVENVVASAA